MPKLYAIPMTLYVEALDEDLAAGSAELYAFGASTSLRKINSGWIADRVTTIVTTGKPVVCDQLPSKIYDKELLTTVFGEDRAIAFLNMMTRFI